MCWRAFAGVAGTSNLGNLAQVRVVDGGAIRAEGSRGERRNDDLFLSPPPLRHGARVLVRHRNKMAGIDKVQIHVHVDKAWKYM